MPNHRSSNISPTIIPTDPEPPKIRASETFDTEIIQHLSALRRYARRRVAESELDDLVQDTIADALLHRHQLRHGASLLGWLMRILDNLAKKRRHRVARDEVRRLELEAMVDDCDESSRSPEAAVLASEVRSTLATLPAGDQRILELVDMDGLSSAEAARELGLSYEAATSRLRTARRRMAAALDARCPTFRSR